MYLSLCLRKARSEHKLCQSHKKYFTASSISNFILLSLVRCIHTGDAYLQKNGCVSHNESACLGFLVAYDAKTNRNNHVFVTLPKEDKDNA